MFNDYGIVSIGNAPGTAFPRFALAETGYDRSKSGYFVLGGFAVQNHNGVILGPSMFLRAVSKDRLSKKSARSWATDIKQWVRFVEFVQVGRKEPPYEFDLMGVDEGTLARYGDFLSRHTRSRADCQLSTNTVRNKLQRVCAMQQWFADNRWFYGDLGPRAEVRATSRFPRPTGFLAHIHKRSATSASKMGPMGSQFALSVEARQPVNLPKALTESDVRAVESALRARFRTVAEHSPRHDQYIRDELIFNVGRFVGLRVENLSGLPVAKILALRLSHLRDTDTIAIPMIGKGGRAIHPSFPVALLRQMQTYAETARDRAVKRGKVKDQSGLFVSHLGRTTGRPIGERAMQLAMSDLFIEGGLSAPKLKRDRDGSVINDEQGRPVYEVKARYSIHALRHTCAMRTYYAVYETTGDRDQAMSSVQAQLCHADITTTAKRYAELSRRFSTWNSFSHGLDRERAATESIMADADYLEFLE